VPHVQQPPIWTNAPTPMGTGESQPTTVPAESIVALVTDVGVTAPAPLGKFIPCQIPGCATPPSPSNTMGAPSCPFAWIAASTYPLASLGPSPVPTSI